MQLIVVLLLTILNYVSSEQANCYVTFGLSSDDNPYINIELDDDSHIESISILQKITDDTGLTVTYEIVDQLALDKNETSIPLCGTDESSSDGAVLQLFTNGLGLDSMACPIEEQTVTKQHQSSNEGNSHFPCEYDFGDSKDSAKFIDFKIMKDKTEICALSISIIKTSDDHTSEEL